MSKKQEAVEEAVAQEPLQAPAPPAEAASLQAKKPAKQAARKTPAKRAAAKKKAAPKKKTLQELAAATEAKDFFKFETPLKQAHLVKKLHRFVATVVIDGKEERCFLPVTVSIGDFFLENLPCLVVKNAPGGKTAWTVKAISVDDGRSWIGIDLNASNRYVEYFAHSGVLEPLMGRFKELKREQRLGGSRLDFKVDDLWLEVKTPVDTLHKLNGGNVRLREADNKLVTGAEPADRGRAWPPRSRRWNAGRC